MTAVVRKIDLSGGWGYPLHAVGPVEDAKTKEALRELRDHQSEGTREAMMLRASFPCYEGNSCSLIKEAAQLAGGGKAHVVLFNDKDLWVCFEDRKHAFTMKKRLNTR